MGSDTKIEWAKNTFNPWEGCTKVSPGCANCYAETRANRFQTVKWGKGQPRRLTSESNWKEPLKWNRRAQAAGVREGTFCASLADVFDPEVPVEWRARLWALVKVTTWLDWLILTKRPENILAMLPSDWGESGYPNVRLGTTVENQDMAEKRISELLRVPAASLFLSCEPLLGALNLRPYLGGLPKDEGGAPYPSRIDWVIVGFESGDGARPGHPDDARGVRDQCQETGTPWMFKQWGEWVPCEQVQGEGQHYVFEDGQAMYRAGKHAAGRVLDGREWNEFPEPLKAPTMEGRLL